MATYCENGVWLYWATTSTACTSSTDTAWYVWTGNETSNEIATSVTWTAWVTDSTTNYVSVPYVEKRTPEQIAADEARYAAERAENQRRADEALAAKRAATEKARALLHSMLSAQQREQLQRDQFFEVIAKHSRRRYRIRQGTHGNVKLLDDAGREVVSYCGQPNNVPTEDAMLAQKLQIEHDEEAYLQKANATRLWAA